MVDRAEVGRVGCVNQSIRHFRGAFWMYSEIGYKYKRGQRGMQYNTLLISFSSSQPFHSTQLSWLLLLLLLQFARKMLYQLYPRTPPWYVLSAVLESIWRVSWHLKAFATSYLYLKLKRLYHSPRLLLLNCRTLPGIAVENLAMSTHKSAREQAQTPAPLLRHAKWSLKTHIPS